MTIPNPPCGPPTGTPFPTREGDVVGAHSRAPASPTREGDVVGAHSRAPASPTEEGGGSAGRDAFLSPETRAAILALHGKYPQIQSAILDGLRLAQDEIGYLPPEATAEVAALLGVSPHHVHSLATFYTMFFTAPVGRHIVEVCDNLSCALWGSRRILARLEAELGITAGETTPDGSVTLLRTIECLAACGGAPALRVGTDYYERMTEEQVVELVRNLTPCGPLAGTPLPTREGEGGQRSDSAVDDSNGLSERHAFRVPSGQYGEGSGG